MKNIFKLEDHVKSNKPDLIPFVNTLWFIKLLDELANKPKLEDEIYEVIKSFRDSYIELKDQFTISVTNKVHVIIDHLPEYFERNKTTLLKTSDQTIEATHSKLDQFLKTHGYFRKNNDDPKSGVKLFEGILAWNSYILDENI